ncbi:MAG TPA: helix-turn-helix transcriptional regulator [Planctomycetaceae bacterium]|jgi:transcriptional regulator with XRE-family HTH domain
MNFFAKRRKELQKSKGETISQFDLAVMIGVTPSAVGSWERGLVIPRLTLAPKLAEVYGVPVGVIEQEIVKLARLATAS